jgi:heparan-alpha-glucosaminide N-acetyltransferase
MDVVRQPQEPIATEPDIEHAAVPAAETPAREASDRVISVDAFRGFVMLLMASEGLGISQVAKTFAQSRFWQVVNYQVSHVQWIGCSLWDLIQPSFSFLVGVSLPYSIACRRARGQTYGQMFRHALARSLALIFLGILLRSDNKPQTYFTFEDTLTQIGLGYLFLFILANKPVRTQILAAASLLFVYWLAFLLYPLPPAGFDYSTVGVPADWQHLQGLSAHWDKNTNLAAGFDQWFLNLFPREKPFGFNGGGYQTLSFIPTLVTMIFGLLAGGLLKSDRPGTEKVKRLVVAGVAGLVIGWSLGLLGICPVVKRIWTPSWTIFSGGWACLLLAAFYGVVDLKGKRKWAFPLVVVGMNSIAMYVIAHIFPGLIERTLKTNLGQHVFERLGGPYAPIVEASAVLFCMWLIVYWMYKRKIFIRI